MMHGTRERLRLTLNVLWLGVAIADAAVDRDRLELLVVERCEHGRMVDVQLKGNSAIKERY